MRSEVRVLYRPRFPVSDSGREGSRDSDRVGPMNRRTDIPLERRGLPGTSEASGGRRVLSRPVIL